MGIYSHLCKKIKKHVFNGDFDEKYQNARTKLVFILYCCSGGFCFHQDVRIGFKKFWIIFNILNFILVNASCLFYILHAPIEDPLSSILPAPVLSTLLAKFGVYIWMFLMRDCFSKIFHFLDDNNDECTQVVTSPDTNRSPLESLCAVNLSKSSIRIILAFFCIMFLSLTSQNFEKFVKSQDYLVVLYPMFAPDVKTWQRSTVVRFVQGVSVLPEMMVYVAAPSLIYTIIDYAYNRYFALGLFLHDASHSAFIRVGEICVQEMALIKNESRTARTPDSLAKRTELKVKKELVFDEIIAKINFVRLQYQRLNALAKICDEKIKCLFTMTYWESFLCAETIALFICSIIGLESFNKILWVHIATLWMLFGVTCGGLTADYVQDTFETANENVVMEILKATTKLRNKRSPPRPHIPAPSLTTN